MEVEDESKGEDVVENGADESITNVELTQTSAEPKTRYKEGYILGIDEAGRGPVLGNLIAVIVMIGPL